MATRVLSSANSSARGRAVPRGSWWVLVVAAVAGIVYLMATAQTGPTDPAEVRQSHGTAVFNSSIIVFREGLEAVLIFAAVTASLIGGNRAARRPVVLGAACAFCASVLAWFLARNTDNPLDQRDAMILALVGIALSVVGVGLFVRYSLAEFLRFWMARLVYEQGRHGGPGRGS